MNRKLRWESVRGGHSPAQHPSSGGSGVRFRSAALPRACAGRMWETSSGLRLGPPVMKTLAALTLALTACVAPGSSPVGPYVVVLGTAQDGGLPQMGCQEELCIEARADPDRRRLVTSLLLADPRSGKRWLFDASPDLREQVERARPHPAARREVGERPALFDGVFLTHAHVGHYAGLMQFGREVFGAHDLPVWGANPCPSSAQV